MIKQSQVHNNVNLIIVTESMKSQPTAFLIFDIREAVMTMYLDARSFSYLYILLLGTYSQNACVRAQSMFDEQTRKRRAFRLKSAHYSEATLETKAR